MIRSLLEKRRPPYPAPAPDQVLMVVGDVHGRVDLLAALPELEGIEQLVFVGDYVDRGPHSADVLRALHGLSDAICLMGNHEEMMLSFLDDPVAHGPRWLSYGGVETLTSFGLGPAAATAPADALLSTRDALVAEMGDDLLTWLRALPSYWRSGNVVITHAGADPALPIEAQDNRSFRWGHPKFATTERNDGLWLIHGHVITPKPTMTRGRINIDTGAYATDRLTAARISDTEVTFHCT